MSSFIKRFCARCGLSRDSSCLPFFLFVPFVEVIYPLRLFIFFLTFKRTLQAPNQAARRPHKHFHGILNTALYFLFPLPPRLPPHPAPDHAPARDVSTPRASRRGACWGPGFRPLLPPPPPAAAALPRWRLLRASISALGARCRAGRARSSGCRARWWPSTTSPKCWL